MAEYIELDAIKRISFTDTVLINGKVRTERIVLVRDIKKLPAADVVPVVRCKDCNFWEKEEFGMRIGKCAVMSEDPDQYSGGYTTFTEPDDFCSCGERKEGAE